MDVIVELEWTGDLRFRGGREGGALVTVDGDGKDGTTPMETLLLALGGCTAADVVEIAHKMREPVERAGFRVRIEGERAPEPPRRYTRVRILYRWRGQGLSREKLERAITLSQEKYCSVLHSLRPDLELEWSLEMEPA
jgi:putative redox protein